MGTGLALGNTGGRDLANSGSSLDAGSWSEGRIKHESGSGPATLPSDERVEEAGGDRALRAFPSLAQFLKASPVPGAPGGLPAPGAGPSGAVSSRSCAAFAAAWFSGAELSGLRPGRACTWT